MSRRSGRAAALRQRGQPSHWAGAVLGGLGSITGALVGGFAVGILSDLIAGYVSANLQLTVVFALIVVVLYLRPQGLFGQAAQVRQ